MRKLLVIFILIAGIVKGYGQTKPMFSQYMYNMLTLNPSYAGIRNSTSLSAIFRKQWVGIEGAPSTFMASVDTKIQNSNWGLGLQLYDDEIGFEKTTGLQAYSSLHIPLSFKEDGTTLSVGVGFGAMDYRGDFTQAKTIDPQDPAFHNVNGIEPTAGFGMLLHTSKWYFGISAPSLLRAEVLSDKQLNVSSLLEYNEVFATGGYVFGDEEDNIKWKPSVLIKMARDAPIECDVNLNLWFNDIFSVGFSYRTGDAVVGLLELQASPRFRIGYAYDYTSSQLNSFSRGTHELMLRYEIGDRGQGVASSIRYY